MELFAHLPNWLALTARGITHPAGNALFCSAIVVWALTAYYFGFKRRIRPLALALESACARLQKIASPEEFAAAFRDLDDEFTQHRLLGDAWREFSETLLSPVPEGPDSIYRNTHAAALYFRRDSLLGQRMNLRHYNALPNLFTGLGILGTFVGLVAGIHLASGNLASDDIQRAKDAMQLLLNGASLAFLTSIFGLLSSIVFSVAEKRWIHRFDLALGCWVSGLDRCMTRVVPEQIASDQLREVRQQTEVIGGFTNQLAFQIAEALEQRMTKSVAPVLETLVQEIRGLRNDRQGTNEAVIEQLVERFTEQLEGAAGTEMEALGVTLGQLTRSLTEQQAAAQARHHESQKEAEASRRELTQLFQDGAQGFRQNVEQSVKVVTQEMGHLLKDLDQRQKTALDATEQQLTATAEVIRQQVGETLETVTKRLGLLLQAMARRHHDQSEEAETRLRALREAADAAMKGLTSVLADLRQVGVDTRGVLVTVSSLASALDETTGRLTGLADPIANAAERFERAGGKLET